MSVDPEPSSAASDAASQPSIVSDAVQPAPLAAESTVAEERAAPRMLIGSQRPGGQPARPQPKLPALTRPIGPPTVSASAATEAAPPPPQRERRPRRTRGGDEPGDAAQPPVEAAPPPPSSRVPVPNLRADVSEELQAEIDAALGGMSLDDVIAGAAPPAATGATASPAGAELEPDSRLTGHVLSVHGPDVFVGLGGRNQGVLPLAQFAEPPAVGTPLQVVVNGLNREDELYTLSLPGGPVNVEDWSQVSQGTLVEARVTGHNKGGLECRVHDLRGFIPASQISLYRVEDLAQFDGQTMVCLITEVKPERRNLVLSRRAVLEREQEQAREKTFAELAVGQVRQGVVRSLRDFGAFVDLGGGIDGLLHVSQLSWARVNHPRDVLQEGQTVTVKVQKIDPDTRKIGLAMKELLESPWAGVAGKYPVRSHVQGKVSKIMDFGAFVELEPGVEGLVHISELAHHRVFRTRDVVQEGQAVEVVVLSVDADKQRIGLSIKAALARPEPKAKQEEPEPEEAPPPTPRKSAADLRGGVGKSAGGDQFGLKW
jgi:small subunit ribosomal protein S1